MKPIRHTEYDNYSCVAIHDTSLDCLIDEWATNNLRVERYCRGGGFRDLIENGRDLLKQYSEGFWGMRMGDLVENYHRKVGEFSGLSRKSSRLVETYSRGGVMVDLV